MQAAKLIIPPHLKPGDTVAIITPSLAKDALPTRVRERAGQALQGLGLRVVWAPKTRSGDSRGSTSVSNRVADINWAFKNPRIRAVWCLIGGFNANQLLDSLDWRLIAANPKRFIGHSDITVLNNAIFAKTGMVTYYGPNLYSLASKRAAYTLACCRKLLLEADGCELSPPLARSEWGKDWRGEVAVAGDTAFRVLVPGRARGIAIGGNASTFYLLQGTPYMPNFTQDTILVLEDDDAAGKYTLDEFDRRLTSIMQQPGAARSIRGLLIGSFQSRARVSLEALAQIVRRQPNLAGKPVVANIPFGHIEPKCLLPIGGTIAIEALDQSATIRIEA